MNAGPEVRTPGGNRANAEHEAADAAILPPGGAAPQIEPATLAEKARATLAAQLALAGGHVLLELADGSFMVTRWGQTRHCPDLHAVAQFARQLGVRP